MSDSESGVVRSWLIEPTVQIGDDALLTVRPTPGMGKDVLLLCWRVPMGIDLLRLYLSKQAAAQLAVQLTEDREPTVIGLSPEAGPRAP